MTFKKMNNYLCRKIPECFGYLIELFQPFIYIGNVKFMKSEEHILLYDGYCNLCHWSVRFVIRNEKCSVIQFAALESDYAKKLLQQYNIDPIHIDSVVFISNQKAFVKSKALVEITLFLKTPYSWFRLFKFVPSFLLDGVYDMVARFRYKIFGKVDYCQIQNHKIKGRLM
ncbi:DUF393 domain-containing protein [Labilibacter sediminis]|nr:DUF393 domain-containing protein [Labilibacter sediminis]